MNQFESPYGDWPKVATVHDNKWGQGVHLSGRYLAPLQRNDILAYWGIPWMFVFLCGTLFLAAHKLMSGWVFIGLIVACVGGYWVFWRPVMRYALAGYLDVRIFPAAMQIGDGFSYKTYDRSFPIEISLEPHRRRFDKMSPQRLEFLRQASEVVMYYGTKRITLAEFEVCDMALAKSLVLRLQDAVLKLEAANLAAQYLVPAGSSGKDDFR